jgi:hypothetical protein
MITERIIIKNTNILNLIYTFQIAMFVNFAILFFTFLNMQLYNLIFTASNICFPFDFAACWQIHDGCSISLYKHSGDLEFDSLSSNFLFLFSVLLSISLFHLFYYFFISLSTESFYWINSFLELEMQNSFL